MALYMATELSGLVWRVADPTYAVQAVFIVSSETCMSPLKAVFVAYVTASTLVCVCGPSGDS